MSGLSVESTSGGRRLADYVSVLAAAVLAALLVRTFFLDAACVSSHSMESTLLPGDCILVNKLIYGPSSPRSLPFLSAQLPFFRLPSLKSIEKGDVVVFEVPGGSSHFVKRCIATPGDTVAICSGMVTVNRAAVKLPSPPAAGPVPGDAGLWVVPSKGYRIDLGRDPGETFTRLIMQEGHVLDRDSSGRVTVDGLPRADYTVEKDYIFVLGDNLSSSEDSRAFGFLPVDRVTGKALLVYWSASPSGTRLDRVGRLIR